MAPCVTAGGGGGMLGGVDLDCVFTSAGESGMVAAGVFTLSVGREHGAVSGVCRAVPTLQTGVRGRGDPWGPRAGLGISAPQQSNPHLGQSSGSGAGACCPVCPQVSGDSILCPVGMQSGGDSTGHCSAPAAPALPHTWGTAQPSLCLPVKPSLSRPSALLPHIWGTPSSPLPPHHPRTVLLHHGETHEAPDPTNWGARGFPPSPPPPLPPSHRPAPATPNNTQQRHPQGQGASTVPSL